METQIDQFNIMYLCKVDFSFVLKEKLPSLVLFLYLF